jgi:hypothetical protein
MSSDPKFASGGLSAPRRLCSRHEAARPMGMKDRTSNKPVTAAVILTH